MASLAKLRGTNDTSVSLAEFAGSMPAAYALAFSEAEITEHAQLVERRQGRPVHVERCHTGSEQSTVICVVADDRAGLLSLICHVLVSLHLEVVSAQIYSRQAPSGNDEAIDFFWVRKQSGAELRAVTPSEVAELERKLGELLAASPASYLAEPLSLAEPSLDPIPAPRAYFDSTLLREGKYLLVVEGRDYPGLLLTITRALHQEGVEVVSSEVVTQGWLARDRFLIRDSRSPIPSAERLVEIRTRVLAAVRSGLNRFSER